MPSNRGVVYLGPGKVEVQNIDFPSFRNPAGKTIEHGVILKVVATNVCGSDQHTVRGRTTAPAGMVPGQQFFGIHVSNHGRVMIFAGGIPLRRDGSIVGAIGVSGGSGTQDDAVARAGASALTG